MPFKSDAHRKKLYELAKEGKISTEQLVEFERSSKGLKLPERAPTKGKSNLEGAKNWSETKRKK